MTASAAAVGGATARPLRPVLADLVPKPTQAGRAIAVDIALVLAGTALVALLAKVSFFIGPVPITGQTLGVIVAGAALGAKRGAAALVTYLLAGLAGLPIFAGATAGLASVVTPSFGFIIGFIPAAFAAGWIAERAWDRRPILAFAGFAAASVVPFLVGVPYMAWVLSSILGQQITFAGVLDAGVWPFILPGLIKAAAAALAIPAAWRLVRLADRSGKR